MLKTVATADLRVGMLVHDIGLSWWRHQFVRPRFLLAAEADVQALLAAGAKSVTIDTDRGVDVTEAAPTGEPAGHALPASLTASQETPCAATPAARAEPADGTPQAPAASVPSAPSVRQAGAMALVTDRPDPSPPAPATLEQELRTARRLVREAQGVIEDAMQQARTGSLSSVPHLRECARAMVESTGRNAAALQSLAGLKTRDNYTFMHCVAVGTFMIALGRRLGLSEPQLIDAGTAGLLHDVGKAHVPDAILNKPGRLTPAEFEVIRSHAQRGHDALIDAGYEESAALAVVRHHHERLDGTGYPSGLSGEQVTQLMRMAAVADVYDAVTSERVYHAALPPTAVLKMLLAKSGSHFDETVVHAFIRTVGIYPNGSLVRLASGRLAVVVEQHATDSLRPRVRAFYSALANARIAEQDIDLAGSDDRIERFEDPARWKLALPPHTDGLAAP